KGRVLLSENPIDSAAMNGETVYIEDATTDPRVRFPQQAKAEGLVSGLCVPMTSRGKTVGVIRVYAGSRRRFSAHEEALVRYAGFQAAAGIIEAGLVQQQHQAERQMRQMQQAADVQRRMIPAHPPAHVHIDFAGVYDPSLELGGDFYDFIDLGGGAVGFCIADVVGKGIPAALIMASVRSALHAYASTGTAVKETITRVNLQMCRDTLRGEFVTVFYGVFAADRRQLVYVNGGHDPPLLLRGGKFRELLTGGMVIGVLADAAYDEEIVDLRPGDLIVFYTDGVIDALNFDGESFGRRRLRESILKYRDCPAAQLADQIKWDTRRFAGLAQQNDDITIVAAKVR
ncbi:MAG: GAF domain-containing SpoIIE family protein phosphatase, partial [Phycisphaerae bacterium]